jgi:prepilin-type N-terminal cleavage/methylation domain-containing protein
MGLTEVILGRQDGASRPGDTSKKLRRTSARLPVRRAGRSAVTLLELILVLVIMGILAAVAVPRFARSTLWTTEGETAARKVLAAARLARRMAVDQAATRPNGFHLICSGDVYSIYAPDKPGAEGEGMHLPSGWTFRSAYTVKFDTLGAISNYAPGSGFVDIVGHGETWRLELIQETGSGTYYRKL